MPSFPLELIYSFLIRCVDGKWSYSSSNCLRFLCCSSSGPLMKSWVVAWGWCQTGMQGGWKLTPVQRSKGPCAKVVSMTTWVFSWWCIYTAGLKFCESNSCCKNSILNMFRTVKCAFFFVAFHLGKFWKYKMDLNLNY